MLIRETIDISFHSLASVYLNYGYFLKIVFNAGTFYTKSNIFIALDLNIIKISFNIIFF